MRSLLLFTSALLLCGAAEARAEGIYRYEEKDGTIIYTNVPPPGAKRARKLKGTFRAAPATSAPTSRARPLSDAEINASVKAACERYRIPEALVHAIMHVESNFDVTAVSRMGASGLMQLMPQTAQDMYVRDIFNVTQNI